MSEHIHPGIENKSSLPLVGVLTLLGMGLLGVVTATAIRHNPLYSDFSGYGISKYMFIESCKEALHNPAELNLNLQGQQMKLTTIIEQSKQLKTGEHLIVKSTGASSVLVGGVQQVDGDKLGLIAPVLIGADTGSTQRPIGQANMQCLYDKATKKTEVTLSVGQ